VRPPLLLPSPGLAPAPPVPVEDAVDPVGDICGDDEGGGAPPAAAFAHLSASTIFSRGPMGIPSFSSSSATAVSSISRPCRNRVTPSCWWCCCSDAPPPGCATPNIAVRCDALQLPVDREKAIFLIIPV